MGYEGNENIVKLTKIKAMGDIFREYERVMAGQIVCHSLEEATRLAETYLYAEHGKTYVGRQDKTPSGTITEILDIRDGAQENPFYCIIL